MSERVLVTGGAGFIGSHVAEALLEAGRPVTVLDAFDPYYDPARKRRTAAALAAAGARVVEGDLRDPQALERALEDVGAVIHLAARPGVRASVDDPRTTFDVNVLGTLALLEAMRARPGLRALAFASSSSVYGGDSPAPFREDHPASRPLSPYAASKRAGEHLCASYVELFGFGVAALRFFTVYGPRGRPDMSIGRFVQAALTGGAVPLFGDGSVVREFTYVADVVSGTLAALERAARGPGFSVYNLGGGATASMRELIAEIEAACGAPLAIERHPPAAGDMTRTEADLTRVRAELGYAPTTSLREGLARTVAWARAELARDQAS